MKSMYVSAIYDWCQTKLTGAAAFIKSRELQFCFLEKDEVEPLEYTRNTDFNEQLACTLL